MKTKFKDLTDEQKQEVMQKLFMHNISLIMRAMLKMSASLGSMHDFQNEFPQKCAKGSPMYVQFLKYDKEFTEATNATMSDLSKYKPDDIEVMYNIFRDALENIKLPDEGDTYILRFYIANQSAAKDIRQVVGYKTEYTPNMMYGCTQKLSLPFLRSRGLLVGVSDQSIQKAIEIIDEIGIKIQGPKNQIDEVHSEQ
jgi:hypothetical protein